MEKTVRTVCQSCHAECGVIVHVVDGTIKRIVGDPNHPMNRGFICIKGRAETERLYHPERIKYPLKRSGERGDGRWERISWDEALDGIAERLTQIKKSYGNKSIASIHGTGPRASLTSSLLLYALGSPNRISVDLHICYAPSLVAEDATFGASIMMEEGPDYAFSNCILVWGGNPIVSHPPRGMEILKTKRKKDTTLIVVDPYRTELAEKADLWLQIRPGTDCALALGMLHVIIEEGLYDKGFVEKWCHGFSRLKERVAPYTPEKIAEITWVKADDIRHASRLYATKKPASLHHRVAVEHNVNSTQTDRALAILVAITGNIDIKGGNLLPTHIPGYIPTVALSNSGPWLRWKREIEWERIGAKAFPLISGPDARLPFVTSYLAFKAIETEEPYPIKALYCAGANPVINMQDGRWVWNTLKKLDLFVVTDFFMTPSAELADFVLPATTWLERDEICDIPYMGFIAARQRVVEPLHEAWDDLKIILELIKRIPWADRDLVPWENPEDAYNWLLKGTGLAFQALKERGYLIEPLTYEKYKKEPFNTPTGKVELFSTIFEKYGYDPLPHYVEPPEGPISTPELMKDYPFILITGSRNIAYFHSEGRQIPTLRRDTHDPELTIHKDGAESLGIKEGDWVFLETPKVKGERVRFRVKIDNNIHPRVVHAPHGWWFPEMAGPEHGCFLSNINVVLKATPPWEEICGSVPTRGTICNISKCET